MRELAGWEVLLGGALLVFLLWRWRPWSSASSSGSPDKPADWAGLLLPILAVAVFVLFLVYLLRG